MAANPARLPCLALTFGLAAMLVAAVVLALPAAATGAAPLAGEPGGKAAARLLERVVMNEVAWAGTAAETSADEWIELYNPGEASVSLSGWRLRAEGGKLDVALAGQIASGGFFLLERADDTTVADIPADLVYSGGLGNGGERLLLQNPDGQVVDSANGDGGPWPGGVDSPDYRSMERINPFVPDTDANWASNDGAIRNGQTAGGAPINGTPKAWNSAGVTAEVGAHKTGPARAIPGADITYTLSLSNSGGLTATGVLVTDTLPAGLGYLRTTAPYSLSQPDKRTLVWQVETLFPGSGPIHFGVTGRLDAGFSGTITNTVRISSRAIERDHADNASDWVTWVGDLSRLADLTMEKEGPANAAAGSPISYSLRLQNQGGITATGVVVTDVLPTSIEFLSQDSPSPFGRPAEGLLVWRIGDLAPGAPARRWTVVGRVVDGTAGPLTNAVSATSASPEAYPADNRAYAVTSARYTPTVRLMAVHYAALQTTDEAVQLINLVDAPADIGGWKITDNEQTAVLPMGTVLPAGAWVWLTRDAAAFRAQFGFAPDFEQSGTDPAVPDLTGSWPALWDGGDEVVLLGAEGVVQDAMVFLDGSTDQPGWSGPAVAPYHPGALAQEGQILYRKLEQATGRPVADTDTAADWAQDIQDAVNGRKVRYPGWDLEDFSLPLQITQTAHLTVAVGPDHLYETVAALLGSASRSLIIQGYSFENSALARVVAGRAAAGVSVTLLLEGSPAVEGVTDQERWVCQQIEAHGGRCLFMINDSGSDIFDRYPYQHAKYVVVDGERALVGSENLSLESMPWDDKQNGTAGRRGVCLITDAAGVVAHLERLFALDADLAHHRDIATSQVIGPPPAGFVPITVTDWISYPVYVTAPLMLTGEIPFEVVQSPESSLRDADALLGLLGRAGSGDTVLVEQMHEPPHWGDGGSSPAADPNLRLEAYLGAARRGARVRVLLDSFFGAMAADNRATCDYLREIASQEQLTLACRQANPTGLGIHNKMVLVWSGGRGFVHVGSINGSELSNKANREVALQVQSDAAYAYLAALFERDWPHRLYLPLVVNGYRGPAGHPLISEVLFNPPGEDDTPQEWVELYHPTGDTISLAGWLLGDAASVDDYEGMYRFPAGATLGPYQVLMIAVDALRYAEEHQGAYPDYELWGRVPGVPDLTRQPGWGRGDFALGNTGDEVLLLDANGRPVDVVVWGAGSFPGVHPHPGFASSNHSLERYPPWRDSDDCSLDFWERPAPSPGRVP